MTNKYETRNLIQNFISYSQTQFSCSIKIIRSDNGPEFFMHSYYASLGIVHQWSCVEIPQQKSIVEIKYRHLLNVTRSFLFHAHLPTNFWSYALCHATYIINRLCSPTIRNHTPFELLSNTPPSYTNLKTFGCLGYASTLNRNMDKLDPRASKSLFLSFTMGIKGYLLFYLGKRATFTSRNCVFHEHIFPYTPRPSIPFNPTTQTKPDPPHHPFLFEHNLNIPSPTSPTNEITTYPYQTMIETQYTSHSHMAIPLKIIL